MDLPITITIRIHSMVCIWILIVYFMSNSDLLICFLVPDSSFPLIYLVNIDFCHLTLQMASYVLIICHLSAIYTEFGVLIQPIFENAYESFQPCFEGVKSNLSFHHKHPSSQWALMCSWPPTCPALRCCGGHAFIQKPHLTFSLKRKKRFLFFILNCELWAMSMRLSLFMLQETRLVARRSLGDPTKPY